MSLSSHRRTVDCLGLGIAPLDILFTVPHFPKAGRKIDAVGLIIQGGGPVPNCLVGLARFGVKTAFLGAFGDDLTGKIGINELKRERVDIGNVIIKKQPSALASGMIESDSGRRTIALFRKIAVKPSDIDLSALPIPRVVHLDGRDMPACMKLARWGRGLGASVSLDIGSMRNDVSALLPLVDHLVVADAFALPSTRARSARAAISRLRRKCPGQIVVTEGMKGSLGFDGLTWHRQPAYLVKNVDTTGAGDSFHAGYLYGVLQGWPMSGCLQFGAAAAAIKCTQPGARTGAPNLKQVQQFLRKRKQAYV